MLLLYFVTSTVGSLVGGVLKMAGTAITSIAPQVADAATAPNKDFSWDKIEQEAMQWEWNTRCRQSR